MFKNISASKSAFIMLTLTSCIAFLIGRMPVELFIPLVTAASAFYFANKGDSSKEFLGK